MVDIQKKKLRRVTKSPIGNTTTRAIYSFGESPSSVCFYQFKLLSFV